MAICGFISDVTLRVIVMAIIYSLIMLALIYRFMKHEGTYGKIKTSIIILGITLNVVVVFTNFGFMPSLNRTEMYGVWMPMTESTKLNYLGDRFAGFSIGDFILITGVLVLPLINKIKEIWDR